MNVDESQARGLHDEFSYYVDGYKYKTKYKEGLWDGKIRLFHYGNRRIYAGLEEKVRDFLNMEQPGRSQEAIEKSSLRSYIENLSLSTNNEPIETYDHQFKSVETVINNERQIVISPTGSGKSLIAYILSRWYADKRILIVVPTVDLVNQMRDDFVDYATMSDWDSDEHVHMVMGGVEKDTDKEITISTWQSIFKQDDEWFEQWDMLIMDEVHTCAADSLKRIMEASVNAHLRVGMTGTLKESKTDLMVLEGLLGPVVQFVTTKELIDLGILSPIRITILMLEYGKMRRMKYADELKYLFAHGRRNKLIISLIGRVKGNTLVLPSRIAHGKLLAKALDVEFIHGKVKPAKRVQLKAEMETRDDMLLIAIMKLFSVGINIKRLKNIFYPAPSKSKIGVLQSLGRSLRKHKTKDHAHFIDFIDSFNKKNHTYRHGIARLSILEEEGFDITIKTINMKGTGSSKKLTKSSSKKPMAQSSMASLLTSSKK